MIMAIKKLRAKEMGLKKASKLYKVPVTTLKCYVLDKEIQCLECEGWEHVECEGWVHVECTDSERDKYVCVFVGINDQLIYVLCPAHNILIF